MNKSFTVSRKAGQAVQIGRKIRMTITKIRNGSVTVNFNAPSHVNIVRDEVYDPDHKPKVEK